MIFFLSLEQLRFPLLGTLLTLHNYVFNVYLACYKTIHYMRVEAKY